MPAATACAPCGFTMRQCLGPPPRAASWRRWFSSRSGVSARSTTSTSVAACASVATTASNLLPFPGVDDAGGRLPGLGLGSAGKNGDRAPLGAHGDPVVGLGQHCGLASDRIAEYGEAVESADEERVEAVEIVEAALERLRERRSLTEPPGQVAGGDLGVVFGLEVDALTAELLAQAVVVRERAVVDEAEIEPGGEGMRAFRGHPALRGHACVAERVRAVEVLECEPAHEFLRPPRFLVDLDRPPGAHNAELRVGLPHPPLRGLCLGPDCEDGVARADLRPGRASECLAELPADRNPVLQRVGGEESQLARAARRRITIDRNAGAVGPAVRHLLEHRAQVPSERLFDLSGFCEQPDDPTHMCSTYIRVDGKKPIKGTFLRDAIWRLPTRLEARQVLADLPGGDLLVVAGPFVPLHADEVVDVVLVAALPERLAQDVVPFELLDRIEEVRGKGLEPAGAKLVVGNRVEVLAVRLAGLEALLD